MTAGCAVLHTRGKQERHAAASRTRMAHGGLLDGRMTSHCHTLAAGAEQEPALLGCQSCCRQRRIVEANQVLSTRANLGDRWAKRGREGWGVL